MKNKKNKLKIVFVMLLLVVTLFMFSVNVSAICEKTIFYRGQCSPNGALSVHRADGTLITSESAGLFSGCFNNLYFIEIGSGGASCDWTPGEIVLFKINGQDVARVPWAGNDYTVDLNLGNQCVANSDCRQQCPGQNYVLQGTCSNIHVCTYSDTCPAITPQCRDGIDNDYDNKTDYPNDPGCVNVGDNNETDPSVLPECADGEDNDHDGNIDYPDDDDCESASDDRERDDDTGRIGPRYTGGSPENRRRGGGGGAIGLPSFNGGGYCNICSDWGECKSSGLKYRNCTTVDCDALSLTFNSFEIIEEDDELNQTRKGRSIKPGNIGSFLNRNVVRNDLADSYNLTISNFTKQTEFYDFYNRADQYILQTDKCTYVGPQISVQESCYDGIKNQFEEGIDCGGPCVNQCIEQKGIATKENCWVWWVILAILLVLLAILVYEHYREEKEILWWIWFAVILLIALDIGLLAVCVGYGFSWWMLLLFMVVLMGMLVGYVFFQKKYENEKLFKNEERKDRREKLESGFDKLGVDVPPAVNIGVLPKSENKKTEIISNLSPSTKVNQIDNLMKSAREDLKKGDLKKVHQTTDKISAMYKSLSAGKQKDDVYKKFMKLYDDINGKV